MASSTSPAGQERQQWYNRFLQSRYPPCGRRVGSEAVSEGYAVLIGGAQLNTLATGQHYFMNLLFFDEIRNEFFGRDYQSVLVEATTEGIIFDEEIFFHAPMTQKIHIVMEIASMEGEKDPFTVGWTVLALDGRPSPLNYYGSHSDAPRQRLKIFPGSPKVLLKTTPENFNVPPMQGGVDVVLLSHRGLSRVIDFFPEYYLCGIDDDIPGIRQDCLPSGSGEPRVNGYVDEVGLSFGTDDTEAAIEELLTQALPLPPLIPSPQEWQSRDNQMHSNSKVEIIERRVRIGVHNGLAYLSSPLTLHLVPREEVLSGTQSLRRRARSSSLGRSRVSSHQLVVRSRISLPIVRDARFALVFGVEYLFGVRDRNGTASHSQTALIGWGVALPFSHHSHSIFLMGGPSPNPDEVLCLKNLVKLRQDRRELPDGGRGLALSFNFTIDEDRGHGVRRVEIRPSSEERVEIDHHPVPVEDPQEEIVEEEVREEEGEEEDEKPPSPEEIRPEKIVKVPRTSGGKTREEATGPPPSSLPLLNTTEEVYEPPSTTISPIARSSMAFLSTVKFSPIVDRNGAVPLVVEATDRRPIDVAIEKNDRLASSEVAIQLMALKWNQADSPAKEVFFTLQFFRFPQVTTERLRVSEEEVSVLKRLQPDERGNFPSGFTSKFSVSRSSLSSTEEFSSFLASHSLSIEVWDASSLLFLGSSLVPLRSLCRRGAEAVQFYAEAPIVQSSTGQPPTAEGVLYLRMANIGHSFSNQIEPLSSSIDAAVVKNLPGLTHSTSRGGRVVRPQPLSASSQSTLQRFLQSQRIDLHRRYAEVFNEKQMESMREWETLKKKLPGSAHHEATLKRFIFEEELEAYRKVRRESKASRLLSAVFKGLTVSHSLSLSMGESRVFEFLLTNPYPHPLSCSLHMDDFSLSLLTDVDELSEWRRSIRTSPPLEASPFDASKNARDLLFLRPNEALLVPFKYDGMRGQREEEGGNTETKVLFKETPNGEPLAILDLRVEHRPFALSRLFRFIADELSNFDKVIRIGNEKKRLLSARCLDPSVKVTIVQGRSGQQLLKLTLFTGPSSSVRTLVVFLYEDSFGHRLSGTWKIVVHSFTRIDTHSVQGQTTRIPLHLPSNIDQSSSITVHCSSPSVSLPSPQPLLPSSSSLIEVQFTPNFIGSRVLLLSMVQEGSLLSAFSLHAHVREPHITSSFHVHLSSTSREETLKKVSIHNGYSIPRVFRLLSSRPDLLLPFSPSIHLPPNGDGAVELRFLPVDFKSKTIDMLLFIQDSDTGQEEETYAIRASYVY